MVSIRQKGKRSYTLLCQECGDTFTADFPGRKFCSAECYKAARARQVVEKERTVVCVCGKVIKTTVKSKRYCSQECYGLALKKRHEAHRAAKAKAKAEADAEAEARRLAEEEEARRAAEEETRRVGEEFMTWLEAMLSELKFEAVKPKQPKRPRQPKKPKKPTQPKQPTPPVKPTPPVSEEVEEPEPEGSEEPAELEGVITKTCELASCGREFVADSGVKAAQRFCSRRCYLEALRTGSEMDTRAKVPFRFEVTHELQVRTLKIMAEVGRPISTYELGTRLGFIMSTRTTRATKILGTMGGSVERLERGQGHPWLATWRLKDGKRKRS